MNVLVLVKQIPDPNNPYQLANNRLKRDGGQNVLDPGDEFGVEAALQLTEANGGEVTVVSMGPESAMEAIRRALSMGAHKGVLMSDDSLQRRDATGTGPATAVWPPTRRRRRRPSTRSHRRRRAARARSSKTTAPALRRSPISSRKRRSFRWRRSGCTETPRKTRRASRRRSRS